ncbi:MAG: DUF6442 family protein, partial [Erysipelotrichaceae bacterium]
AKELIMTKEEIVEKAKKENANQEIYEQEIIIKANRYACLASGLLATLLFIIQIFAGKGTNYGLYAEFSRCRWLASGTNIESCTRSMNCCWQ